MILLNKNRINRTLKRMSYQILEEARHSGLSLVGLNERGYALAGVIRSHLREELGEEVELTRLDVDDDSAFTLPGGTKNEKTLVLIDDVIFSGETMFTSIRKIPELSAFKKILVAVLVDRGHRKYPVLAGIVGMDVPTKLNEEVELRLEQNLPAEVVLIQHEQTHKQ